MPEPWINFSDTTKEIDQVVLLRADGLERVHVYRRPDGSYGRRNFVWIADEFYQGWTVGADWGHVYDSVRTAVREAQGAYPWIAEYLPDRI